ncbi:Ribosome association toxin PasT (RatA) of the RatAB toxin-antitoxin module [Formivibrio citricus]|uniref:Ribosome association toxin PasT (RatA) of the RatAB toxin-antitoxin module n=1 Tax=Formivibrio citricus TaxID=83765 RepID=A0A1I4Y4G7_9NEIS|nr:type II toxin-antitoxin system RatA family toxin [Formivibrio citricus]SFN32974.1 Ribosome association toxin PasT (RatA) of the RatAB toxin-antitoxin module [Formivibrio citricus]
MHCIRKSMLAPYSAEQMFNLVDRVEDYPRFLPWCGGVEVHERSETVLDATLHIRFLKVQAHFRTRDNRFPHERIEMRLADGPFKHMDGFWRFIPLSEDACKVEFELDYAFASRTLEALIGPVFDRITSAFVDAFIEEAERRHGE